MKKIFIKMLIVLISVLSLIASMIVVNAATLDNNESAYFVTYDDVNWFISTYSVAVFNRVDRTITDTVGRHCKAAIEARGLEDPYDEDDEESD